jgi:hypothetical protein
MVTVSAVLSICEKDSELSPLWTTARTGRVVYKSLTEAMRTKFWGFEVFKATPTTPGLLVVPSPPQTHGNKFLINIFLFRESPFSLCSFKKNLET